VLDDRAGSTVDLLVGEQYEAPYPLDDVAVSSDQPLQNRAGCVAIAEVAPQPLKRPAAEASE
jgi:hypothetical protein